MELIYNELSTAPICESKAEANQKVARLIACYKEAQEHGFDRIRFSRHLHEIEIAGGYTLQHWLEETDQRNYKDILLGARTYPSIRDGDEWAEDEYLRHHFYFESAEPAFERTECLGLAAAHIYDTLSISFTGSPLWERNTISITKVNDETQATEAVDVTNVYSENCFDEQIITAFIERIAELVLVESPLQAANKPIHFRPDHGTDVLNAFARRIRNSIYVTSIVNSLPWNPRNTNFIRRVYPNGLVEVVLFWTDEGLGMVIQTTGRNQRETEEIARRLEEEYSE